MSAGITFRRACVGLVMLLSLTADAAQHKKGDTLVLKEPVGRLWSAELIHYDLAFAPGEFPGGTLRLTDGDEQEVPVQLSGVGVYDDGCARSGSVSRDGLFELEIDYRLDP